MTVMRQSSIALLAAASPAALASPVSVYRRGARRTVSGPVSATSVQQPCQAALPRALAGHQGTDGQGSPCRRRGVGGRSWKSEDSGTTFRPVFDKAGHSRSAPWRSIRGMPKRLRTSEAGGPALARSATASVLSTAARTGYGPAFPKPSVRITKIIVDPANSQITCLCARCPGGATAPTVASIVLGRDGGASWSQILKGTNLRPAAGEPPPL
jgi:hypothetical protein